MNSKIFSTIRPVSLIALAAMSLSSEAWAQQTGEQVPPIDEPVYTSDVIIVTAQRRAEAAVDVPISVTTLDQAQLKTANVEDLSDIQSITPGLRFNQQGGFFQPTIRGIGTSVTTSGGGANVGIYVDGFYSPNPLAANVRLMNVETIQVLKGPQGTLFGRNTTGGAILVDTKDPSVEPGAAFKASYGRFNQINTQAYVTSGITDNIAIDVEGQYDRGDGWQTDIVSGRKVGDYWSGSVRTGLKVDFHEALSALLRYEHSESDDPRAHLASSYRDSSFGSGAPNFAVPGQFTFAPDKVAIGSVDSYLRSNSDAVQLTIEADLGFAELVSYTQYRDEDVDISLDLDNSAANLVQFGFPVRNKTFTQELLLTSKPGSSLEWTAGLFYFSNRDTYTTFIDNNRDTAGRVRVAGSSATPESFAAFVDATYEVVPDLFVTVGARYAHDKVADAYYIDPVTKDRVYVRDVQPEAADDAEADRVTPRLVLRYKPDERSSIYASYTKGYKAAVLDVGGGTGNYVEPETVSAFELGYKYDGGPISIELAGFYYDYKNLQVSLYKDASAQLVNAASSEIYGIDGQVRWQATDRFQIAAGAAWTHGRYKRFEDAPIYVNCNTLSVLAQADCAAAGISFPIVSQNLRNETMQRTPEFTGNVTASYSADLASGDLLLSGNLAYTSKFYFGPSGVQFPQKGYETLSLRAEWTDPSDIYTLAVWGDNVTDSRYLTNVQYTNYGIGANWSRPATYGVEVGFRF